MLDKLIESKKHSGENHRRSGFLLTTFTAVVSAITFALIYSLFSYNLAMANDKLDISTLVTPVNVSADVPLPPKQISAPKQQNTEEATSKLPSRQENIQRVEEIPHSVPAYISTTQNTKLSRPAGQFKIGSDSNPPASGDQSIGRNFGDGTSPSGVADPQSEVSKVIEDPIPPPPIKTSAPKAAPTQTIIRTGRVLNGQAINLVKPPYPSTAKAVRASGAVTVQVTIDENGNVTSANAVAGHLLLRQVSEQAAGSSKFSSTFLGQQRVKVTGVIVYNFVAQ